MCDADIALREFQAFALMWHKMTFHLFGKVIALHLDNNTANAYLHNQGGTVSLILSTLAILMWKVIICCGEGLFLNGMFLLT